MSNTTADRSFLAGIKAGINRDYEKAVRIFSTIVTGSEGRPEAYLYLGRSFSALDKHAKAIDAFRQYLRLGGDSGAGNFFLGRSYYLCGRTDASIRCLRRSLELQPRRAQGWAFLGAAYLKEKKSRSALDCLERATTLAPADTKIFRGYLNALYTRGVKLIAHGDADMGAQMLRFAHKNGISSAAIHLWLAKALRSLNRVPEALEECSKALTFAPDDPSIQWIHAGLLLALGNKADAVHHIQNLVADSGNLHSELPKDDSAVNWLRAMDSFKRGDWKSTLQALQFLIPKNPKVASLRALAAECLRETGEADRSLIQWTKAIALAPDSPEFRTGIAMALFDVEQYREALESLSFAKNMGSKDIEIEYYQALCRARLGENPKTMLPILQNLLSARLKEGKGKDPRLFYSLGETLYRSGRPDLALSWFEKVLEIDQFHERTLLYLIAIFESLEDSKRRAMIYETYLAMYPDNNNIRKEYITYLVKNAEWKIAAAQLEQILQWSNPGARTRELLAICYRRCGRYRDAAIAYKELFAFNPHSSAYLLGLALSLAKDDNLPLALAVLDKAPRALKPYASHWMLQTYLNIRCGKLEKAKKTMLQVIELTKDKVKAWKNVAHIYKAFGYVSEYKACMARAKGDHWVS